MVEVHRVPADLIGVRRGVLRSGPAEVDQRRVPDVDVGPLGEDHVALHARAADRDLRANDDVAREIGDVREQSQPIIGITCAKVVELQRPIERDRLAVR